MSKVDIECLEESRIPDPYSALSSGDREFMERYEGEPGRAVVRKVDYRLVPIMGLLYLLSHIDRGNIGNAKIEGMDKDLGLVGNQYNIASTIFFVPYIIFEIPSNIVLKKVRPSLWLSFLVLSWGTVMTLMGLVKDFQGMMICRVFLGLCEAGFFPGAVYIVSTWYPRYELQQRLAIFYTASAFSGALSGLLAFGVAHLRLRLSGVRSQSEEGDKLSWRLLFQTMTNWKIGLGILLAWANSVSNAAFKFTMPQIIKQLGFPTATAQLLTIPPYFCGGVAAWITGRMSDKFTWRMPFIVGPMAVLAIALGVLFNYSADVANNVPAMYVGVVLAQIGIYPLLPGITAWIGKNLAPSWKRSIGIGWLLAAGNLGSIIGTNVFLDKEGPRYPTGYGTSLGIIYLGLISAFVLEFFLWSSNKKKSQRSEAEIRQQYSQEQLDRLGEKSPLYQYTL
ncbi:hypothetical protein CSUB01_12166 [Colletotrichum sublineola]|uniref:Major facilitator superfamily transporter n=1 Tax=Colletotrichum sublineola TaxID=1173701 RepID=A0A066Y2C8_COLSU|nr:hypothetical protein CSUB01_12166 [Colletotrichum sublineola]